MLYLNRTVSGNCNHCDSCRDAPAVLKKGGELTLTVKLQKEADAVDVKFFRSYTMPKIKLNGKDSYEMKGNDSGKVWTLKVKYDNFSHFKPGEKLKRTNVLFALEIIRGDKTEMVYAPFSKEAAAMSGISVKLPTNFKKGKNYSFSYTINIK